MVSFMDGKQLQESIAWIIKINTGHTPIVHAAMQVQTLKWKVVVDFQGVRHQLEFDANLKDTSEFTDLLTQLKLSY